ncbi:hypothetical protein BCAH1134_C0510 (plasmid) [Bacillus cereus AH1134]|nr:hypothetical protein BCAH1134_C0510 [Bacillus cereus AH1134]
MLWDFVFSNEFKNWFLAVFLSDIILYLLYIVWKNYHLHTISISVLFI